MAFILLMSISMCFAVAIPTFKLSGQFHIDQRVPGTPATATFISSSSGKIVANVTIDSTGAYVARIPRTFGPFRVDIACTQSYVDVIGAKVAPHFNVRHQQVRK